MQGVGARMIRLPADPLIFQPFNCEIIPYVFILLLPGDGRGVGLLVRVEWRVVSRFDLDDPWALCLLVSRKTRVHTYYPAAGHSLAVYTDMRPDLASNVGRTPGLKPGVQRAPN